MPLDIPTQMWGLNETMHFLTLECNCTLRCIISGAFGLAGGLKGEFHFILFFYLYRRSCRQLTIAHDLVQDLLTILRLLGGTSNLRSNQWQRALGLPHLTLCLILSPT